ncbi:MAG: hypothetical protein LBH81_02090, partial [Rickettsiales bacterium]|nr:hypothetical protein [Rickettsiales bacterium]
MAKQTKKLIQFIGFLLSVWIFGRGANAAVSSEDLSANSKSNSIKQIDSAKFAQTGEVASRDNRAYMFAYVC